MVHQVPHHLPQRGCIGLTPRIGIWHHALHVLLTQRIKKRSHLPLLLAMAVFRLLNALRLAQLFSHFQNLCIGPVVVIIQGLEVVNQYSTSPAVSL